MLAGFPFLAFYPATVDQLALKIRRALDSVG